MLSMPSYRSSYSAMLSIKLLSQGKVPLLLVPIWFELGQHVDYVSHSEMSVVPEKNIGLFIWQV